MNEKTKQRLVELGADPADLRRANLRGAYLSGADLTGADLGAADLTGADLTNANLTNAYLTNANLTDAYLTNANLTNAYLTNAYLTDANLTGANLRRADLRGANLSRADLSGATGLIDPADWMADNFERTTRGYFVYKAIGDTSCPAPSRWEIKRGAYLTETANPNRTDACGCGVNFGAAHFVKEYYYPTDGRTVWRCLIEWRDLPGVVVPYNTDGKARCARLKLVRPLTVSGFDEAVLKEQGRYGRDEED